MSSAFLWNVVLRQVVSICPTVQYTLRWSDFWEKMDNRQVVPYCFRTPILKSHFLKLFLPLGQGLRKFLIYPKISVFKALGRGNIFLIFQKLQLKRNSQTNLFGLFFCVSILGAQKLFLKSLNFEIVVIDFWTISKVFSNKKNTYVILFKL